MKIRLYITTYKNEKDLTNNLNSLFASKLNHNIEVIIINNHSDFSISKEHQERVLVLHNSLRPDFSTGHLSRNWNQALINGFRDLNNPDTDFVMTCQDDTIFKENWLENILQWHKIYNFISLGAGDNFCSYTAEAVKTIGLWDERFCNIGFQEADYFIRALMYNKEKSSINDQYHRRVLHPLHNGSDIIERPEKKDFEAHHTSMQYHNTSRQIYREKYGILNPEDWTPELINNPPKTTLCKNYVFYPYFEKNVIDLIGKNYVFSYDAAYGAKDLLK